MYVIFKCAQCKNPIGPNISDSMGTLFSCNHCGLTRKYKIEPKIVELNLKKSLNPKLAVGKIDLNK